MIKFIDRKLLIDDKGEVFNGTEKEFKKLLYDWQKKQKNGDKTKPRYDIFYELWEIDGFEIRLLDRNSYLKGVEK